RDHLLHGARNRQVGQGARPRDLRGRGRGGGAPREPPARSLLRGEGGSAPPPHCPPYAPPGHTERGPPRAPRRRLGGRVWARGRGAVSAPATARRRPDGA